MTTEAKRTEDSLDIGRRYRYDHLQLRLLLRDLYFSRDGPGGGRRLGRHVACGAAQGGHRFRPQAASCPPAGSLMPR